MHLGLLISPLARGAYFADYVSVCQTEVACVLGCQAQHAIHGNLDLLECELNADALSEVARLSFIQGAFEIRNGLLRPLQLDPRFNLPDDFVFGSKYRGKTNEVVTQLLVNLGLRYAESKSGKAKTLLDPMCGRGTTLMTAMRFGLNSKGIEQDKSVLADITQSLKKWTKLHRVKHSLNQGFVGRANKQGRGRFVRFSNQSNHLQVIIGDSRETGDLMGRERFDIIATDLPYGVQHHTTTGTRNPIAVIEACATGWANALRPGGAMVIAYNRLQPKPVQLINAFDGCGLTEQPLKLSHRMSESIIRDILVLTKSEAS
ncbi:MAG: hypothetical protein CMH52_12535 [Myxococcales bacterium]|nr:hypothetical protein [Myxococcales bacterium]